MHPLEVTVVVGSLNVAYIQLSGVLFVYEYLVPLSNLVTVYLTIVSVDLLLLGFVSPFVGGV